MNSSVRLCNYLYCIDCWSQRGCLTCKSTYKVQNSKFLCLSFFIYLLLAIFGDVFTHFSFHSYLRPAYYRPFLPPPRNYCSLCLVIRFHLVFYHFPYYLCIAVISSLNSLSPTSFIYYVGSFWNVGWGCLRIGCWGEYLGLRGTGWPGVEKIT